MIVQCPIFPVNKNRKALKRIYNLDIITDFREIFRNSPDIEMKTAGVKAPAAVIYCPKSLLKAR